jgi:enamine deaminase RidA (YjgF/YER057c/UK114 family)
LIQDAHVRLVAESFALSRCRLENRKRRLRPSRGAETIYVSELPPFDPATAEVVNASIKSQIELALEQMKLCLETAGSSLEGVLKCNVYCTSVEKFAAINAIYARYFPQGPTRPRLRQRTRMARTF